MSDPLGLISNASTARLNAGNALPPSSGSTDPNAPSFKDSLMQNLEKLNAAQQDATAAAEDLATGKRNDVENVLLATQKADQAFRMALALRNKVQAAYDELKQVRI